MQDIFSQKAEFLPYDFLLLLLLNLTLIYKAGRLYYNKERKKDK